MVGIHAIKPTQTSHALGQFTVSSSPSNHSSVAGLGIWSVPWVADAGEYYSTVPVTSTFEVAAGTHTFYLVGSGANASHELSRLNAQFLARLSRATGRGPPRPRSNYARVSSTCLFAGCGRRPRYAGNGARESTAASPAPDGGRFDAGAPPARPTNRTARETSPGLPLGARPPAVGLRLRIRGPASPESRTRRLLTRGTPTERARPRAWSFRAICRRLRSAASPQPVRKQSAEEPFTAIAIHRRSMTKSQVRAQVEARSRRSARMWR